MGILNLTKLLADIVPQAIKENEIKNYFGEYGLLNGCIMLDIY